MTFTNGEDCALRLVDGVVKTSDNCPTRNGTGSLTPDYNARPIDLYVSINYQDVHIPIRIADALEPGDENMVVDIPGDVSPTTFPQDRWVFDARAWLSLPYPVNVSAMDSPRRYDEMPLAIGFAKDDRLDQWQLDSRPALTTDHGVGGQHYYIADPYAVCRSAGQRLALCVHDRPHADDPRLRLPGQSAPPRRRVRRRIVARSDTAVSASDTPSRHARGDPRPDPARSAARARLVLLVVLFTWKATSGPRSRWSRDPSRLRRSAGWGTPRPTENNAHAPFGPS